jgi:hypothetical protein
VQKIEEMRITIEDLEALKELSDELEENHTETEKQLHEDLGKILCSILIFLNLMVAIRGEGYPNPRTCPEDRESRGKLSGPREYHRPIQGTRPAAPKVMIIVLFSQVYADAQQF